MFSGLFGFDFIFVCVICILLLAFDFWTVKNVTGRLLVGLRWWNYVKEDGTNEWVFESLENMSEVNANDSRVFWMGLYVPVAVWTGLLVIDTLKLQFQVTNGTTFAGFISHCTRVSLGFDCGFTQILLESHHDLNSDFNFSFSRMLCLLASSTT